MREFSLAFVHNMYMLYPCIGKREVGTSLGTCNVRVFGFLMYFVVVVVNCSKLQEGCI